MASEGVEAVGVHHDGSVELSEERPHEPLRLGVAAEPAADEHGVRRLRPLDEGGKGVEGDRTIVGLRDGHRHHLRQLRLDNRSRALRCAADHGARTDARSRLGRHHCGPGEGVRPGHRDDSAGGVFMRVVRSLGQKGTDAGV